MNVLIIPEDFRKDQYLLKPLFSRLFSTLGRPSIHVRICQNPLLGSVWEALKVERLTEILERYEGKIDIFVLCIDRDGDPHRRQRLDRLEREFERTHTFLAENAWEEVETWTLAGLTLPGAWRWADVRGSVHVKEEYFEIFARQRGVADTPDGGRRELGAEAARRIDAIRQKCPEDFDALAQRLEAHIRTSGASV